MKIKVLIFVFLMGYSIAGAAVKEDTLHFGRFGVVYLYRPDSVENVVLFVSGDGGWNLGVVDMANSLSSLKSLVIGIDIIHYLKELEASDERCSYPAADFEALSQYIQKKLELPQYIIPALVGYSSGATLVYAMLVQAPVNTFIGAISLGFCPDLPLTKPFCKGEGLEWDTGPKGKGYSFKPAPHLEAPWIAFQGLIDQVCDPKVVADYVKKTGRAQLVPLPKVGHGFSVQKNWLPQFTKSFRELISASLTTYPAAPPDEVKDLPIVEVPSQVPQKNAMAVIISGDGGWAMIDREVGNALASKGIPVVGLNSLKYFWDRRTPDETSADLQRILRHYMDKWKMRKAVLIGYSRGADVLPFMANRLPPDLLDRVSLIALIGPENSVDFQFHLSDFFSSKERSTDLPTYPEVEKLKGKRLLCYYGADEKSSLCPRLDTSWVTIVESRGGHHFGGEYGPIADKIMEMIQ